MALEMRPARETDDLRPLWETAFFPDETFFARDYRPERALLIADGQKPVSMLHMLPQTLRIGEAILRAGYIMGVATDPSYQKQGLAGRLIRKALTILRELGNDCATLIPASAELARYYGKFGLNMRGRMPDTGGVTFPPARPAVKDDIPALSALYDAAYPDRAERGAFEWETILLEYGVMIYEGGYTAGDERGVLEMAPMPRDLPESHRAACIKPYTIRAETLLSGNRPFINLLYT